ncbi:lactoylglutathione lyase [Thermoactinomyces vulgaris]|jgi:methylmalonyl-CoA/ethylmalonyl-CoA epimerase|uniref:Methylmalonyl-CoA epimerase n=1 Tax=Laceyella sediminis TaxID=573074 RepID=A0ABX5ELP6_9BACL|nr:methylmalonyl-CoA epimerase [Laceyella sediminis]KPC77709.1 lactoylglutathione lyase [Thermoactinomyces vulgaris]PRZ13009.1 methylmalonyl-CoA epimerase [Laceyella sediminis]
MKCPPKKISHIGIAVWDLQKACAWYQEVLGLTLEGTEEVESEQVRVGFLRIGESRIELLEPMSEESAIHKYLVRHGEGIHHLALEVSDIKTRLREVAEQGVRLINEEPKPGAHQMNIAFLHPKSTGGVLLELCEARENAE